MSLSSSSYSVRRSDGPSGSVAGRLVPLVVVFVGGGAALAVGDRREPVQRVVGVPHREGLAELRGPGVALARSIAVPVVVVTSRRGRRGSEAGGLG